MLKPDGTRSDLISFSCSVTGGWDFIHNLNIDTFDKALAECRQRYSWSFKDTDVNYPFLKTNIPGKADYAYDGYNFPVGPYFGSNSPYPGWGWVTTMAYGSAYKQVNSSKCTNGVCSVTCQFLPFGPESTWVKIINANGVDECVAPPYSTSGAWWDAWKSAIGPYYKFDVNNATAVQMFLGMDGEGRPYKSAWGWGTPAPGETINPAANFPGYVKEVFKTIKNRYPGKKLRAHYTGDLSIFLENEVDIHWESIEGDENNAYIYAPMYPNGWHQVFTNNFWVTNTLGLNVKGGPAYYVALSALSKHTDGLTGIKDPLWWTPYNDGKGDWLKFVGRYIGKDINDTPGVWIALRETEFKKEVQVSTSGKYGDYDYYLYRPEELQGAQTVPVSFVQLGAPGVSNQRYATGLWGNNNTILGRKNTTGSQYMYFDVDDGWRYSFLAPQAGLSYDFRVVYLDSGTDSFQLQYKNQSNQWATKTITKTNSNLFQEAIFNVADAYFNNSASEGSNASSFPTDFRLYFPNGPTVINLIEVLPKKEVAAPARPKAQVSCALVRNIGDDPKEGVYTIVRNDNFYVRARLVDQNGNPLVGERIMFNYNTEWNYAQTIKTDSQGYAYYKINTTNNVNRSGFMGAGGGSGSSPSWYSAQTYFPGNNQYQPSRNDCMFVVGNVGVATRMKVTKIDNSTTASTGKVHITYQIIDNSNPSKIVETKTVEVGKNLAFYSKDPSAQTIQLVWTGNQQGTSNNITLYGNGSEFPSPPVVDITPPVISNGSPSGILPIGTTQTTISVVTNENATCKYSTTAGISYSSLTNVFSTTGAKNHSATVTGLQNGLNYNYYVRCQDAAGNANTSDYNINFFISSISDTTPPSTPTNLIATAVSSSQINLSWTASTDNFGVTGYRIYRGGIQIGTSATNSYSDTGLAPSTYYSYTVAAYDATGNLSGQSNSASATTPATAPQSPYPGPNPMAVPGTIEAENFDNGGEGVAYHDTDNVNQAGSYRSTGVDISACSEGGYNLGYTHAGEWLEYTVNVSTAGLYDVEARITGAYNGTGNFHIEFNGVDKTGPLAIPSTGGWGNWLTIKKAGVSLSDGQQVMKIVFDSQAEYTGDINYIKFTLTINTTPPNAPTGVSVR